MDTKIDSKTVLSLARAEGFEAAGIAAALPSSDGAWYIDWVARGMAASMRYLTDHRAQKRLDPKHLLPSARSILCVGKVYNGPQPYSTKFGGTDVGWISRYAWGLDYHKVLREGLERVVGRLRALGSFEYRVCVDTAPILERSYARMAGLGWIGRNTCLIHQQLGSWMFLGEMLLSLDLEPGSPVPDRCGTCRRCIDACPTEALVRTNQGWELDSRLCLSYLTIEHRGGIAKEDRPALGRHIFGCDICQDVCPWNGRAATSAAFAPVTEVPPPLDAMAALTEDEFRRLFHPTPIERTRYSGFLRNVAIAMGNSGLERFVDPLRRLAASTDPVVAEHAEWALQQLNIGEVNHAPGDRDSDPGMIAN